MSELHDALVDKLEDENDVLRARIANLEKLLLSHAPSVPIEWQLTASERLVFSTLVSRERVTKDQIMAALYRDLHRDEAEPKIVDVFICKLRRKLKPFGIKIETVWGVGYYLDPLQRAEFSKIAEGAARAA